VNLESLKAAGEELRELFAQERRAIAALDQATLGTVIALKQAALERLRELASDATPSPELAALFRAIRVEAQATAMLASTASQAVRALLGYEQGSSYDRRARTISNHPLRILAAT
jgi:hypothetical protein